jgi:hypothetical protein
MPEFLHLFAERIRHDLIKSVFEPLVDLSAHFEKNWVDAALNPGGTPFEILAIDSSSQQEQLPWEGIFML